MSSSSQSRPSASQSGKQSRPVQSTKVASSPQRPSTPSQVASQRPGSSGQKVSSAAGSRVESKPAGVGAQKPSQAQVQQHLNLPQQGGKGMSDAAKIGIGAAAGSLGVAGAKQLLDSQRPGGTRPEAGGGVGERPGIGERLGTGERPAQLAARPNAGQIRDNAHGRYDNLFSPQWWRDHPNMGNAHWQNFGKYQLWRHASWAALGGWVAGTSWDSPAYYNYGEDIYYQDEQVYMNGKPVAGADEYYQQATTLAKSAPPAQESETDWLPLGVFAISRDQATDSNMVLQLAVEKDGVIAGTYYNTATDVARPVRGMVDKKTQRAAWTFADGKNTDTIMETGIFNLTQAQTEALVHFGKEKTQQCLLVRLNEPKSDEKAKEGER
jgi:hypothetical protein